MMRRLLPLLLASATLGWPLAATSQILVAGVGPGSSSATQVCTPSPVAHSGSTTQTNTTTCMGQFGFPGSASAQSIAATGHVGAQAEAFSNNGDSLVAANNGEGLFQDFLTFTSSNPGDTTANVSVNLLLDGILAAGGNVAGARVETTVILNGAAFSLRYNLDQAGVLTGSNDFIVDSGVLGPMTDLAMHTPFVTVLLNSPTLFRLDLQTSAGASGPNSHALSAFFDNSFKLPSGGPAFQLPDGVTVNARDYLVNNRFIDPLATAGVPEPASWAMMISGFGLAGALLRRRHAALAG